MPDVYSQRSPVPDGWHDAFAALPLEQAPADGWSRVSARLQARRRPQWTLRLAAAAALVAAVALPLKLYHSRDLPGADSAGTAPIASTSPSRPEPATLDQLYAESAQLESLLQVARDDRVSSAAAAAMSGELDARIAAIDAALTQPGLSPERQLWLWRGRVEALRSLTSFESNRRWLAANGERYDAAVARVD